MSTSDRALASSIPASGQTEQDILSSMSNWYLTFEPTAPITLEVGERILAKVVEAPVEKVVGELSGNPRDYYARTITLIAQSPVEALRIELEYLENMRGPDDPEAILEFRMVTLRDWPESPFAMKLALWHAMRRAFAEYGCTDRTVPSATMVDDADGAGDPATAAKMRAEITELLVTKAVGERDYVDISSPPDDLEAVLAAYPEPERVRSLRLSGLGLTALPVGFDRFPNIESLALVERALDPAILRGMSRPRLTHLNVLFDRLTQLTRDDLAGFPALGTLCADYTPLESIDHAIIEACPKLYHVSVRLTPLAKDKPAIAALRAAWPGVHTWDLKGIFD